MTVKRIQSERDMGAVVLVLIEKLFPHRSLDLHSVLWGFLKPL